MLIILKIYLVSLCLIGTCIFLLIILGIHKFFIHHIFILYLYYTGSKETYMRYRIKLTLGFIGQLDLITYLLRRFIRNLLRDGNHYGKFKNVSKYHPYHILDIIIYYKRFHTLITISPLLFIVYDCIFNDWVLTHVYYYLLFYIPLMIIKRISTSIGLLILVRNDQAILFYRSLTPFSIMLAHTYHCIEEYWNYQEDNSFIIKAIYPYTTISTPKHIPTNTLGNKVAITKVIVILSLFFKVDTSISPSTLSHTLIGGIAFTN